MKMNKTLAALCTATLLFAGCSSSSSDTADSSSTDTGAVTTSASVATDTGEVTATITKEDGKVTKIVIDEVTESGDTKKDLGDDYGMKSASGIGKEWNEQIEFLENYMVENGIDSVTLDSDGYATEEDVLAGCTINLSTIMEAVDEANSK